MPVQLDHTIVSATDPVASATFLADVLGVAEPRPWGPFQVVEVSNGVTLDYLAVGDQVHPQHYAFLVTEAEFDVIFDRIRERGLAHWADPHQERPDEINHNDGGRGVYWNDPDGHLLEIITRPYGSGGG